MIEVTEEGCWIWRGYSCKGYGVLSYNPKDARFERIRIGRRNKLGARRIMAHQLFYFLKYGNPPSNTELGHTCNRRSCCNPDHVRPVTSQQNASEMYRMPTLSRNEREAIEEAILDDQPLRQIADYYCVSVWSVRKIASELDWRDQYKLDLEVPF